MTGEPCDLAHEPEEYQVIVRFHRDGAVCVEVEYPAGLPDESVRQTLPLIADVLESADLIAVPAQRGR